MFLINLSRKRHRAFITKMASLKCRIPNIDKLDIFNMNNECDSLAQFLLHCVPHSLQQLNIYPYPSSFCCDPLCYELAEAVKGVTHGVCLGKSVMSGSTFEAIFKAASQARSLWFFSCQIDSSGKLDLDGPDYKWVVSTMWMMHYQYSLIWFLSIIDWSFGFYLYYFMISHYIRSNGNKIE